MYNNNGYNRNSGPRQGNYNRPAPSAPEPIRPLPLPEDYVAAADSAIRALAEGPRNRVITTSKLRSLFSLFTEIYNEVTRGEQETLTKAQVSGLSAAKVRIYYEIGREDGYRGSMDDASVGRLVKQAKLLQYLADIGDSPDKLLSFYHYMEALVAFHRFYFGDK